MTDTKNLLTDEQIDKAWANADFGESDKRKLIAEALLKYLANFRTGHTIEQICFELDLINSKAKLKALGKKYLFLYYSKEV